MKRFIGSGRLLLTVLSFLAGTSLAFAQEVNKAGRVLHLERNRRKTIQ